MATAAEYQAAYLRIFQNNTLSDAQAAALAAQDTGPGYTTGAFQAWAQGLTTNAEAVYSTGGVAAIWSALTGRVPTTADLVGQVNTIEALTQQFGNSSIAFKALGASLANSATFNGTFAATYGQDTTTVLGQQAFVQQAFLKAFGREATITELNTNVAVFQTVKAFYAKTPVTETTTDRAPRGEFIADLLKQAVDFSIGPNPDLPVFQQIGATLVALGSNTYVPNAPIEAQPGSTGSNIGTTTTLTVGADNVVGTSGNDLVNGYVNFANAAVASATSTFTGADTIALGNGTDTLALTVDGIINNGGLAVGLPGASVTGIETLSVRNITTAAGAGDTLAVNAASYGGLTQFVADRSTAATAVANLANNASVVVNGDGIAAGGTLTAGYAAGATAAGTLSFTNGVNNGLVTFNAPGTVVNVSSSGGAQTAAGGQVNTINGLTLAAGNTTLNINAASSLTTGAITAAGLTSITASGAATNVNIGTAPGTVTSIDASGLTAGGVTATLTGAVTSFKGGAGVDTVTTAATTAAGAVIDGGSGRGDILNLAATNDVTTSAKAAQYVNFEVLRNSTTGAVDASLFSGITAVQTNASGAGFTNLTAAQANAVTVRATNANATFSLANSAGTSDVLRVNLNSATNAQTAASLTGVTVNGFETVNVVSSSGTNGAVSQLSFTGAADLTALNLSGVAPLNVSTTNIVKAVTIDASQMTFVPTAGNFALTLSGNLVKGSVVTATAAADSITTTAAIAGTSGDFVVYNAGGGNDAISSTLAAINNTSGANGSLKIDGGAGTDTLTLTDAGGITAVDANFQFITNVENISYTVANRAISITSGGFFDTNFKTQGVNFTLGDATNAQVNTVNLQTFTGNATVALTATAATTQAQTIITGTGNDTVTLLAAGTTTGAHVISTGAGTDTINVTISGTTITTGTVTINGGTGADTINITGNSLVNADTAANVVVRVNEGGSLLSAFDTVSGWVLNDGTKQATLIDFDGTAVAAANVAATAAAGFTNVNYAITNGLMTFTGTGAGTLTAAQKASIAQTVVTAADATVIFNDGADTYVFHNGVTTDDLVKLAGVTGAGIDTAATFNANFVAVA